MGGGAEAPIAAIELFGHKAHGSVGLGLAALGGLIGAISLSGSLIAWGKLDGRINKTLRLAGLQAINGTLLLVLVATGAYIVYMHGAVPAGVIAGFFAPPLVYGVLMRSEARR